MRNEDRKKIILFGSEHCQSCSPVKDALEEAGVKFSYVDITSGMPQLQFFLKLRDASSAFDAARENGKIGIPCLQVGEELIVVQGPEDAKRLITELELVW